MKVWCSFLTGLVLLAAPVPNLTGDWYLSVQKSHWGSKAKPESVVVKIEHAEPSLKYSGVTTDANANQSKFEVDGEPHSVKASYGPGQMVLKRINQAHAHQGSGGRGDVDRSLREALKGAALCLKLQSVYLKIQASQSRW